jgi:pyruvate dehydrogenase E2 component (dihydrolipoamide acetyltransferase)
VATPKEVRVPDIGDFEDVDIIEVLVSEGDFIDKDQSLITLESDKATMEVPSPYAGKVQSVEVKVGDKVSEGSKILTLELSDQGQPAEQQQAPEQQKQEGAAAEPRRPAASAAKRVRPPKAAESTNPAPKGKRQAKSETVSVKVPDIGDFESVDVIEVLVKPGDTIHKDDSLVTLESDKATMEVPSTVAGTVRDVQVKVGDKVSEGDVILNLERSAEGVSPSEAKPSEEKETPEAGQLAPQMEEAPPAPGEPAVQRPPPVAMPPIDEAAFAKAHASPSVRRFARELGVDLGQVEGSGPKNRILKEDVQEFVKRQLAAPSGVSPAGFNLPPIPEVDFAQFGDIETRALTRIQQLSGANLHRNWVSVPHVTQFDEADITQLEAFRKTHFEEFKQKNIRLSLLPFLMKAVVAALKQFPDVNSSLHPDGQRLILKKYFHIGIAVDTPQGLVVPVIRDVDTKGIADLAQELAEGSAKARERKLAPADMQGGCFTISSLGGIGGTAFSPIINVPEVAILGVSRAVMKPRYEDGEFVPRLMLPLALAYDHRVIDGAAGARFVVYLSSVLADIRRILL